MTFPFLQVVVILELIPDILHSHIMVFIVRICLPEQMRIHKLYILNVPLVVVSKPGPDYRILEHIANLALGPFLFRCWLVLLLN